LLDGRLTRGRRVLEASMELEFDGRRTLLFLFLSQALKIIVFYHRESKRSGQKPDARQKLLIIDPRHYEFIRMNLNTFSLPGTPLLMVCHQIF
jgi:hypothetical protein